LERTAALIERVRAEYLFLAVALPWGLALVFLVPPFRIFDEPMHYERAWSVADGQLLSALDGTVRVPANVAALFNVAMATKPRDLPHLLSEPISKTSERVYTSAAGYGPIGYLPQAIGIDAVRLIKGSPLAAFYVGRTANLLASLLLICLAVRLVPFGKRVVGARVVDRDDGRHHAGMQPTDRRGSASLVLGGPLYEGGSKIRANSRISEAQRSS